MKRYVKPTLQSHVLRQEERIAACSESVVWVYDSGPTYEQYKAGIEALGGTVRMMGIMMVTCDGHSESTNTSS